MLIYPAIDLQGGRCVRLRQGRFEEATVYGADPFAQLADYRAAGAAWAHIVDLDGARAGRAEQHGLIGNLAAAGGIRIQAGGGIRGREEIAHLLDAGAARAVVGSAAVGQSEDVHRWLEEFGAERICLALDVKTERGARVVAVRGWMESSGLPLEDALALYPPGSARHVLITDVSRDGMMGGPAVALIREVAAARPDLDLQASGGVATLDDLAALKAAGAAGAIVGRALFEGAFALKEALGAG
ncbi:MAG TPA: 1-(5-phosphoribosyl)-5-[(5-phosphoribosylamino)methylideneamino]imidazole-4-carboxamide isomerase [Rhizomicrobium sp.]